MNDQVREAVAKALKERGISQKDFAQSIDLEPPNLSRLLNGHSGRIPENWQRILDALELDLVAMPRKK
ncbi:helix-turn-helix domain-containing protein [Deinococcus grandis]|nr:helix-turn-helix transcriptional regulator [Deinococcus grandis]